MTSNLIDIGDDHYISFYGWFPDRNLNPQFADRPDIENLGLKILHRNAAGEDCTLLVYLNVPGVEHFESNPKLIWEVKDWDSLTIAPSLICLECGDHGFIVEGKWVDIQDNQPCELCYIPLKASDKADDKNHFCVKCTSVLSYIYEAFNELDWNWDLMKRSTQIIVESRRKFEDERRRQPV